jgi:hypothetical protein
VVASHDRERAHGVRPGALLDVLDPGAVDAEGDLVFGLARNGARVASDARRLVDHEPVTQTFLLSRLEAPSDVHTKDGTSPPLPQRAYLKRQSIRYSKKLLDILRTRRYRRVRQDHGDGTPVCRSSCYGCTWR